MPAGTETIGSWTASRLIRFLQSYIAENPPASNPQMTVDELTVASKLIIQDQLEASDQAKVAIRASVYKNAASTSNLTLTTSYQAVPNLTYTPDVGGLFVVHGTFDFEHSTTGGGFAQGALLINGVDQGGNPLLRDVATNIRATISQTWLVQLKAKDVIALNAKKTIAAGVATAYSPTSTLVVHNL